MKKQVKELVSPEIVLEDFASKKKIVHFMTGNKYLVNWQKFCDFLNGEEQEKEQAREKKIAEKLADEIWVFIQAKVREEVMKQSQMKLME